MKLLAYAPHYVSYGHNAGGETSLHALLREVNPEFDIEVLLSTAVGHSSYTVDGIPVTVPRTSAEAKSIPFVKIPECDVVISQLMASKRAGILARQHDKPSVCYVHNDYAMTLNSAVTNDFIIYNTNWVKDRWGARSYSPPVPPGLVVHPVINPEHYRVNSKREYITLINLSNGQDKQHSKGAGMFYEMVKRFPQERFLAVKGAYGHQQIEDAPNVTLLDHTSDIRSIYSQTKVILLPSHYESYGRVPLEAACSGIPSVVSNLPGVHEAMGLAGNYADPYDPDEWEQALCGVLYEYYEESCDRATLRAHEQFEQSLREIEDFSILLRILEEDGVDVARSYLTLP